MAWTLTIDDDGMITLPEELITEMGWKEGDALDWYDNEDGSFSLRKHGTNTEETRAKPQNSNINQASKEDWDDFWYNNQETEE
jgi:bifunctional DNA-binding transcriptional regulator/antitoxin component of YhaV-PrlF toxin-antitoxin module